MSSSPLCCGVRNFDSWPLTLMRLRMRRDSGDSSGEGTSRRWLVGEWGGVRWAAALPGAAGASVCPQSEAEPSGGANRLVMRRRRRPSFFHNAERARPVLHTSRKRRPVCGSGDKYYLRAVEDCHSAA